MKNKKSAASTNKTITSGSGTLHKRTRSQTDIKSKQTQNIFQKSAELFRNFQGSGESASSAYHHGTEADSHFRKTLRNYSGDISKVLNNYRLYQRDKDQESKSLSPHSIHHKYHKQRTNFTLASTEASESIKSPQSDAYYTSRLSEHGDYDSLVEEYNQLKRKLLRAADSDLFLDNLSQSQTEMADEEDQQQVPQEEAAEPAVEEGVPPEEVAQDEAPTAAIEDSPPAETPEAIEDPAGVTEEPAEVAAATEPDAEVRAASVKDASIKQPSGKTSIRSSSAKGSKHGDDVGYGDPLEEAEALVKQASTDIDQIEQELQPDPKSADEKTDNEVIKEVEECERQCMEIYGILNELKTRVGELMNKETRSDEEDCELEQKQTLLNQKMHLLEEKTRRIEQLIGRSKTLNKEYDQEYSEDILPKVIMCGLTDCQGPNLIVCDEKKAAAARRRQLKDRDREYGVMQEVSQGSATSLPCPPCCPNMQQRPPPPRPQSQPCPPCPYQSPTTPNTTMLMASHMIDSSGPGGPCSPIARAMASRPRSRGDDLCSNGSGGPGNVAKMFCAPCLVRMGNVDVMDVTQVGGSQKGSECPRMSGQQPQVPQIAQKLNDSYCMQDKLAQENADLECKRYQLQEDLLNKDCTVETLQRRLCTLQNEMRSVCKENCILNEKLDQIQANPCNNRGDTPKCKKMPCGKGKGICPAEVENRLNEYNETTGNLEKQLTDMENEVKTMQQEISQVRQERLHLEQHRRMICPATPCMPSPCMPQPPCAKPPPCLEGQHRELREQYKTLQDDYKGKVTEIGGLRADVEKQKKIAKDAEDAKKVAEEKNKENEKFIKQFKLQNNKLMGSKETLMQQEQELIVAKQRYREAKDELDEVRALVEDQETQLSDYRSKYLQAQQQVEEQRRQIDLMEMENNRIAEQVNLEIQRVKNQFQEKLQELTPLPDILKNTQLKLQEAQQMHMLAERNNEGLVRELQTYRDKAADMINQMEKVRSDNELGANEKQTVQQRCDEFEKRCKELEDEVNRVSLDLARMEELANEHEQRTHEKLHEIAQLQAELDNLREESARQVSRTKDRCETVRRSMQGQISDLERQLALSRAQARTAQKDRDEIRQKMQSQINNLNENFEDAQMRIRNLQGHVNFLKNSYTVFTANEQQPQNEVMDPCGCGSPGY